jgi:hypothetical protein
VLVNKNEVFELSGKYVCIDIGNLILNSDTRTHVNTEKIIRK